MSFFYCRGIHGQGQPSITNQSQANRNLGSLDFNQPIPVHWGKKSLVAENSQPEGHHRQCEHGQTSFSERCHKIRFKLRRFVLPAIFVIVALGGLLAWGFVNNGTPALGADLMRRDGSFGGSFWTPSQSHSTLHMTSYL